MRSVTLGQPLGIEDRFVHGFSVRPGRSGNIRHTARFAVRTATYARAEEAWSGAHGALYVDRSADPAGEIVIAMRFGNGVVIVPPPRGSGEHPGGNCHDPNLPPRHHYPAA
ncbi:cobaltochelatase subunit CobN [Nocardia sp. NPDC055321]